MDVVVRSYMRLQAIGKICTVCAWVVLAIGAVVCSYIGSILFPAANLGSVGSTYIIQLLVVFGLLAILIGGISLLLFASGALIKYITIQDSPSAGDSDDSVPVEHGDQDEGIQVEIASIPENERNALT